MTYTVQLHSFVFEDSRKSHFNLNPGDRTPSFVELCIESLFGARFVARSAFCCCPQSHANDVWFELLLGQAFVAVSAISTWHLCVSHSSLVCGDSSPTRLLISGILVSYLVDIICGCCEPCLSYPCLRRTKLLVKCWNPRRISVAL